MKRISVTVAMLLIIASIGGTLYWYFVLSQKPVSIGTPSPTPTPEKKGGATLGELVLCKDFQKIENEISCEEAIGIATAKYPGIVREIDRENNFRFNSSDQTGRDLWRLEIKLKTPVTIKQTTFDGMRILLDRKSGEELRKRYRTIP